MDEGDSMWLGERASLKDQNQNYAWSHYASERTDLFLLSLFYTIKNLIFLLGWHSASKLQTWQVPISGEQEDARLPAP